MAMGESLHTVTTLPTARQPGCPFDPPAELIDARRHGPISRYTFPGGNPAGWSPDTTWSGRSWPTRGSARARNS